MKAATRSRTGIDSVKFVSSINPRDVFGRRGTRGVHSGTLRELWAIRFKHGGAAVLLAAMNYVTTFVLLQS